MDKNIIKKILEDSGYEVVVDTPYKKTGHRLKIKQGTAVICYNSGKVDVRGKLKEPIELLLNNSRREWQYNNKVFIVYGHDIVAKNELSNMISSWGLYPLMIDSLPTGGRTIIEQLEHYIPQAAYGVVLATPDDIGRDKDCDVEKYRARQNVVLELGMLYATLGRKRVAILVQDDNFERPSDIDGIIYMPFKHHVGEIADKLKRELKGCGYRID